MKAIVTGGCGFIGSHFVDLLLRRGHEVVVLDNFSKSTKEKLLSYLPKDLHKNLKIVKAELSQPGAWSEEFRNTDWVIHLAALIDIVESKQYPRRYFESNLAGTFNVLEACREFPVKKFLYVGSGSCFGIADQYPTPEDTPKRPQYPYALFKLMGEDMAMHWSLVYGVPAVSVRFFNLYGPRCTALFERWINQLQAGKPLAITGDGSQTRDFTYITDATEGMLAALERGRVGEAYNIGSGETVPVKRVAELLGGKIEFIERRPGEMDVTFGDIRKAMKELGWKPQVQIEKGIQLMMQSLNEGKKNGNP